MYALRYYTNLPVKAIAAMYDVAPAVVSTATVSRLYRNETPTVRLRDLPHRVRVREPDLAPVAIMRTARGWSTLYGKEEDDQLHGRH